MSFSVNCVCVCVLCVNRHTHTYSALCVNRHTHTYTPWRRQQDGSSEPQVSPAYAYQLRTRSLWCIWNQNIFLFIWRVTEFFSFQVLFICWVPENLFFFSRWFIGATRLACVCQRVANQNTLLFGAYEIRTCFFLCVGYQNVRLYIVRVQQQSPACARE